MKQGTGIKVKAACSTITQAHFSENLGSCRPDFAESGHEE